MSAQGGQGDGASDGGQGFAVGAPGGGGDGIAPGDAGGQGCGKKAAGAVKVSGGSFAGFLPDGGVFLLAIQNAADLTARGVGDHNILGAQGHEFFRRQGWAGEVFAAGQRAGFAHVGRYDGGARQNEFFGDFAGFVVREGFAAGGGQHGVPDDGDIGLSRQALRDGADGCGGEQRADFDCGDGRVFNGGELGADVLGGERLGGEDLLEILRGDAADDGEGNARLRGDGADVGKNTGAACGIGGGKKRDNRRSGANGRHGGRMGELYRVGFKIRLFLKIFGGGEISAESVFGSEKGGDKIAAPDLHGERGDGENHPKNRGGKMIELNAEFWCELVASFAVTVMARIGFAFALSRKKNDSEQSGALSEKRGDLPECAPSGTDGVLEFLRESVRLAEDRIKAQDDHARALERKAVLLGALCVFTVAFLLSGEFDSPGAFVVKLAAIVLLVIAATFCAQTIDFSQYGRLGLYAPEIHQYVEYFQPEDLPYLYRFVLSEHYASIGLNDKTNGNKVDVLTRAKQWWVCGTSAALGALAGNSEAAKWACELACGWLGG